MGGLGNSRFGSYAYAIHNRPTLIRWPHWFTAAGVAATGTYDPIYDTRHLPRHRSLTKIATVASVVSVLALRSQDRIGHTIRSLLRLIPRDVCPSNDIPGGIASEAAFHHVLRVGNMTALVADSGIERSPARFRVDRDIRDCRCGVATI